MMVDGPEKIRNLCLAGHGDTGKTTLASAILYTGGVVNRLAKVEDGHTTTDFDPEEVARGSSISLATCFVPWQKHKINLIDTPGLGIFHTETRSGMQAADTTLLAVNAAAGIEVSTEKVWATAEETGQPVMICLTKLDRENTDFATAVATIQESFGHTAVPLQVPIGTESGFRGVVDLVTGTAWEFERDGDGNGKEIELPDDVAHLVDEWRTQLVEAVAESSEDLMEKYFEEEDLSGEQLREGLRDGLLQRKLFPIVLCCPLHGIGVSTLLDALVSFAPDPLARGTFGATDIGGSESTVATVADGPLSVLVFKTLNDPFSGKISIFRVVSGDLPSDTVTWNTREETAEKVGHLMAIQGKQSSAIDRLVTGDIGGVAKLKVTHTGDTLCARERPVRLEWIDVPEPAMSFAIEPKTKGDDEKIGEALHRLMEEDLALRSGRDAQTGEFLLSGTGQLHVEIACAKLKNRYKVEVILHPPKVPYRETIRRTADGHGRHKKQTGGRGQFGDCKIIIEPLPDGQEFEFVDEIFGGSIPQGFRPAVEKGIQEARARGYLAGFPVVNFRVRLKDGQYHDVDSSEMAFKVAGSLAFKDAMAKAAPTLLEPVMQVEIQTSEDFTGDIMGDLSQRRGRPQGMDTKGSTQIISATVPMAEMLDYAPALRSITQGRASFHMEFSHYEEIPRQLQQKLIEQAKREAEEH